MSRSTTPERTTAGFTLIEVLVALSIVAISLSPIVGLIAATVRGTRSIERHLAQLEIARTVTTALPNRDQLVVGSLSGEIAAQRWRVDVSPFAMITVGKGKPTSWVPEAVAVTISSPTGGVFQINTVRLHRRAGG